MTATLGRLRAGLAGRPIGPLVLLVLSALAVGAVVWGALVADPDVQVFTIDAGPVDRFAIGEVTPFEEIDVYLVGLENGRLRAVDGIVRSSGCAVRWLPNDRRALSANPDHRPGVFLDPCADAAWAINGNAVSGTREPLRTFFVTYARGADGVQHAYVEVLGRPAPTPAAGD